MDEPARDPRNRFSDRVENYVKYRPGYPPQVLATLRERCGMTAGTVVADIGSGTGIFTAMLLDEGCRVFAIEPNAGMRRAAETRLGGEARFKSVAGTAEETGLPPASVDLVVAAQAFHWFDRDRAKAEFRRVLRPGGHVALIWNERLTDTTPFLRDYEALLKARATDYLRVNHMDIGPEIIRAFFEPAACVVDRFPNSQTLDLEGLTGRCMSSSYVPNEGQPGHRETMAELKEIFARHQVGGTVALDYRTTVRTGG